MKAVRPLQLLAGIKNLQDSSYDLSTLHLETMAKEQAAKSILSLLKSDPASSDGHPPRPVSEFLQEKTSQIEDLKEREYNQKLEEIRTKNQEEVHALEKRVGELTRIKERHELQIDRLTALLKDVAASGAATKVNIAHQLAMLSQMQYESATSSEEGDQDGPAQSSNLTKLKKP
jgi:hypothetical protein